MPGQQLQTTAFVLTKQPSGSDSFEQLTAFSAEHGVLHCLARMAKASSSASARRSSAMPGEGRLDFFDETELWLESSNQGRTWFIKEQRLIQRHDGIGRSYDALKAAAALGALLARNPVPDESREEVAALLRTTFTALAAGGRPDIVWLKALYCLLRDEGYPVKQQWWPQLAGADRDIAAQLLNQPLAAQTTDAESVTRITRSLENWVRAETEIRL
jgi:recombinational DNA repair protein (RecF pathway)